MSVRTTKGDLFDPTLGFDAIGHGINTQGKMGAGIAKVFATKYPGMYRHYKLMCEYELIEPGDVFYWVDDKMPVYNIASQKTTGKNASLLWLGQGLYKTLEHMTTIGQAHLGLPWIGCGIGGLEQKDAFKTIGDFTLLFPDIDVTVVEL